MCCSDQQLFLICAHESQSFGGRWYVLFLVPFALPPPQYLCGCHLALRWQSTGSQQSSVTALQGCQPIRPSTDYTGSPSLSGTQHRPLDSTNPSLSTHHLITVPSHPTLSTLLIIHPLQPLEPVHGNRATPASNSNLKQNHRPRLKCPRLEAVAVDAR